MLEQTREDDERFNITYSQASTNVRDGSMTVEAYENMRVEYDRRHFFRNRVYPLVPPGGLGIALVGSAWAFIYMT